jgi:elongation factor Ts
MDEGKPEHIAEKIVEGRMNKFYEEIVLMEQALFKDDEKTIADLLQETVAEVGESIQIARFARYELGQHDGASGDDED